MAHVDSGARAGRNNAGLILPPGFDQMLARRERISGSRYDSIWSNSPGPEGRGTPDLSATADQLPPGIWPDAADSLYSRLAQTFGGYTPHVFGDHAAKAFPELEDVCKPLVEATGYDTGRMVECKAPNTAVIAFGRNRKDVPLQRFRERRCPLCRGRTHLNAITPWKVTYIGPPRWCLMCSETYLGVWPTWPHTQETAIAALQHYVNVAGFVPTLWEATVSVPYDIPDVQRDNVMAAKMALPYKGNLKRLGLNPWANYVDAAGFGGESLIQYRGTQKRAADGHWCRSLFECEIDNFMTRNGIAHQPEPLWPAHPKYNASGRRRADWQLSDGTMVEAAGMMASPEYAAKMHDKKRLAASTGIPLMVILPQDLPHLNLIFMKWL